MLCHRYGCIKKRIYFGNSASEAYFHLKLMLGGKWKLNEKILFLCNFLLFLVFSKCNVGDQTICEKSENPVNAFLWL